MCAKVTSRKTLCDIDGEIDFRLINLTKHRLSRTPAACSKVPSGAVVACDAIDIARKDYRDYIVFVRNPANGFSVNFVPYLGA